MTSLRSLSHESALLVRSHLLHQDPSTNLGNHIVSRIQAPKDLRRSPLATVSQARTKRHPVDTKSMVAMDPHRVAQGLRQTTTGWHALILGHNKEVRHHSLSRRLHLHRRKVAARCRHWLLKAPTHIILLANLNTLHLTPCQCHLLRQPRHRLDLSDLLTLVSSHSLSHLVPVKWHRSPRRTDLRHLPREPAVSPMAPARSHLLSHQAIYLPWAHANPVRSPRTLPLGRRAQVLLSNTVRAMSKPWSMVPTRHIAPPRAV